MLNVKETKSLLKEFAWTCYEFWANELDTDNDADVWKMAIKDLEAVNNDPFSPQGDLLDVETKAEFMKELKKNLGIGVKRGI